MSQGNAGRVAARAPAASKRRCAGSREEDSWRTLAWRDAPSWLVSAVLHLSALILFGLLFQAAEHAEITQISLSWAPADKKEADEQAVALANPTASEAASSSSHVSPSAEKPTAADEMPPAVQETSTASNEPSDSPQAATASAANTADKRAEKTLVQPVSLLAAAKAPAELVQPSASRDGSAKVSAPRSTEMARYERLAGASSDDAVVDRFTLADIGKLGGRQGQDAKADFKGLGTDAIPALVRGLNRSAKIAQSCPVAEIYRKLDELLAKTDDPYMLLYALENTGRGVHPRAEHWRQIIAARNAWQKKYRDRTAPLREQLGSELRPQRALEAGRPLSEADADELAMAVVQTDPKIREEALAAIAKRGMTFGDAERFEIAQPLIAQLEDRDQSIRHSARKTLIALAGGREIGPSQESLDRDPAGAAGWWRDRWTQLVMSQSLARGRSSAIVEALGSSSRGDRVNALEQLVERGPVLNPKQRIQAGRALIAMLSDTERNVQTSTRTALRMLANGTDVDTAAAGGEAKAWDEYWDTIELRQVLEPQASSLLGLARSLEERGMPDAAKRYYERIVREFPRTSAATLAQERLAQK